MPSTKSFQIPRKKRRWLRHLLIHRWKAPRDNRHRRINRKERSSKRLFRKLRKQSHLLIKRIPEMRKSHRLKRMKITITQWFRKTQRRLTLIFKTSQRNSSSCEGPLWTTTSKNYFQSEEKGGLEQSLKMLSSSTTPLPRRQNSRHSRYSPNSKERKRPVNW